MEAIFVVIRCNPSIEENVLASETTFAALTMAQSSPLKMSQVHEELHTSQVAALSDLLVRHGIKATTLAKRAGVSPSTVTRKLADSDVSVFDAPTWAKLFRAVGEEAPSFGGSTPSARIVDDRRDVVALSLDDVGNDIEVAVRAFISGRPHLSAWVLNTRALDALGYFPGDIVVVNDVREPRHGEMVVANLLDWQRANGARAVLRLFHSTQLLAASSDPKLIVPIPIHPDWVVIKGVVEMMFRRTTATPAAIAA
jgi:AcrR family transcriptional regulator